MGANHDFETKNRLRLARWDNLFTRMRRGVGGVWTCTEGLNMSSQSLEESTQDVRTCSAKWMPLLHAFAFGGLMVCQVEEIFRARQGQRKAQHVERTEVPMLLFLACS